MEYVISVLAIVGAVALSYVAACFGIVVFMKFVPEPDHDAPPQPASPEASGDGAGSFTNMQRRTFEPVPN